MKTHIERKENANGWVMSGMFIAVGKLLHKIKTSSFQGIARLTSIKQKWLEWRWWLSDNWQTTFLQLCI